MPRLILLLLTFFCAMASRPAVGEETPLVVQPEVVEPEVVEPEVMDEGEGMGMAMEPMEQEVTLLDELTEFDTTMYTKEVHDQLAIFEAQIAEHVAKAPDVPETSLLVGILAAQRAWSHADALSPENIDPDVLKEELAQIAAATAKALPALDRYLAQAGDEPNWQAYRHRARCLALQKTTPKEVTPVYLQAWKAGSAETDAGVERAIIDDLCHLRSVSIIWSDEKFADTPFQSRILVREQPEADAVPAPAANNQSPSPDQRYAEALAVWDVEMTQGERPWQRAASCKALFLAWKDAHPEATKEAAIKCIRQVAQRHFGYAFDDDIAYEFAAAINFSLGVVNEYVQAEPEPFRSGMQSLIDEKIAILTAEVNKLPAVIPKPPRFTPWVHPPTSMSDSALFDVAALRARACAGHGPSAFDLSYAYAGGFGVATDESASGYWDLMAHEAKFIEPAEYGKTPEANAQYWRALAEQGSVVAMDNYADRLRDGAGVPADDAAANRWYRQAIAAGSWSARVSLAQQLRGCRGEECDPQAALAVLTDGLAPGDARSIAEIGWCHEAVAGVPRDMTVAASHYRTAADLGNTWAQTRLADLLLVGQGVPENVGEARKLLEQAVKQGNEKAVKILAEVTAGTRKPRALSSYRRPQHVPATFDLTARQAKAEAGDAGACYDLALAAWKGRGMAEHDAQGRRWMERARVAGWAVPKSDGTNAGDAAFWKAAAAKGSIQAAYQWGRCLRLGDGVPADVEAAGKALKMAAQTGSYAAELELAEMLSVQGDDAGSRIWLQRAAAHGQPRAQVLLAKRLESGQGVARDPDEARRLTSLAAAAGFDWARIDAAINALNAKPRDLETAAGHLLGLAGFSNHPTPPRLAAQQLEPWLAGGDPQAFNVQANFLALGIIDERKPTEALAYAIAANRLDSLTLSLSWYCKPPANLVAARYHAAHLVVASHRAAIASSGVTPANVKRLMTVPMPDTVISQGAPGSSAIAAWLRAHERTEPDAAAVRKLKEMAEPFAFTNVPEPTANARVDEKIPWWCRLTGLPAPLSGPALDDALIQQLTAKEPVSQAQDLHLMVIARRFYGIGEPADPVSALAWALAVERDLDLVVVLISQGLDDTQREAAFTQADVYRKRITK